jgi:hypothetical protein
MHINKIIVNNKMQFINNKINKPINILKIIKMLFQALQKIFKNFPIIILEIISP